MKNSKKILTAGMVIGCLTVGSTGMIALANGNAYQNFKNAAMQTSQIENKTVKSTMSVTKNGEVFASGTQTSQTNGTVSYSVGEMVFDGKTVVVENAKNDSEVIFAVDGQYTRMAIEDNEYGHSRGRSLEDSPNSKKLMEMVTDILVGDVKNHFSGDQNHVSVTLDGAQVPELVNVAVAAMSENSGRSRSDRSRNFSGYDGTHMDLSQMSNLQIKSIAMDTDIVNGVLDNTNVSITVTYKNPQGQAEEMTYSMQSSISDIGSTNPGTIDLTGKQVEEINR